MLKLDKVSKAYRTTEVETLALDQVSLEIHAGEFVAIMGPSGCGKSTLLNVLGLLDSPTSGSYGFFGEDVAKFPERRLTELRRDRIGFVFQSFNLIDDLTVSENVDVALIYRRVSASDRKKRVADALERVGISHRARHRPQQLSGGQQQRVAIARALAMRPQVLLLDEVTSALDPELVAGVLDVLRDIARSTDITRLCVTHEMNFARDISDQVLMFDSGRVIEAGSPEKIFNEPEHDRTREFLSAVL